MARTWKIQEYDLDARLWAGSSSTRRIEQARAVAAEHPLGEKWSLKRLSTLRGEQPRVNHEWLEVEQSCHNAR